MKARRRWLRYDLSEAKVLWEEESRGFNEEGRHREALRAAATRVSRALYAAYAIRGPPEPLDHEEADQSAPGSDRNGWLSEGLEEAMQEALTAVAELQRIWKE